MKKYIFDIAEFETDKSVFDRFELFIAVKSFDLQAIRKRYLASRKRSITGSVERRQPAQGGLVKMIIENGKIIESAIIARLTEPRGIDFQNNISAVSSENKIFVFNQLSNKPVIIENDWLSYIHTVRFNRDSSNILVSSSGLDSIFEFEIKTGKKLWEWFAWENGFNRGENPESGEKHILTRFPLEQALYKNEKVILINDPKNQILPTALRAAFINSAEYVSSDSIFATLFHHGLVIQISKKYVEYKIIFDQLSKPHGGMIFGKNQIVTDTGGGRVIIKNNKEIAEYHFHNLPGKPAEVSSLEWLQFSRTDANTIITIDSNRSELIFVDTKYQKRMHVPFNSNWALQEFQIVKNDFLPGLKTIKNWFNNLAKM